MGKIERVKAPLGPVFTSLPLSAKVLLADDQLFDLTRLRRIVTTLDFVTDITHAQSLDSMRRLIDQHTFDLILIGDRLADGSGLDALKAAQTAWKTRDAATVFVTDSVCTDLAVQALKRGCGDYVSKDDLAPSALKRAAINAFQKAGLRAMLRRTVE